MKLAAFADEISPDLDEQIRVCLQNGVRFIELRGVAGKNVLDFDAALRSEIRTKLQANGMGIACIGSPIGKVKVNDSFDAHFDRFKTAVELAEFFSCPLIRIFSYYPPEGDDIRRHRDEVPAADAGQGRLCEEPPRHPRPRKRARHLWRKGRPSALDLLKSINSPKLRAAFDFANFVVAGEHPLNNWPLLRPYLAHIHVKDAVMGQNKMVPAGQGDGQIEPILADANKIGYSGFLTLEPHLKVAGHSHGETGPELFKVAADALKSVCQRTGIVLE